MASWPRPEPIPMRELIWSPAEKVIARKAFHLALSRELDAAIRKAKDRAAKIQEPSELWELEYWLSQCRRKIDRTYDFRYSVLPLVFAVLLRDGRLSEDDLGGLSQDKLERIRLAARS